MPAGGAGRPPCSGLTGQAAEALRAAPPLTAQPRRRHLAPALPRCSCCACYAALDKLRLPMRPVQCRPNHAFFHQRFTTLNASFMHTCTLVQRSRSSHISSMHGFSSGSVHLGLVELQVRHRTTGQLRSCRWMHGEVRAADDARILPRPAGTGQADWLLAAAADRRLGCRSPPGPHRPRRSAGLAALEAVMINQFIHRSMRHVAGGQPCRSPAMCSSPSYVLVHSLSAMKGSGIRQLWCGWSHASDLRRESHKRVLIWAIERQEIEEVVLLLN